MTAHHSSSNPQAKFRLWLRILAWTLGIVVGVSVIASYRFKKYVGNVGGQEVVVTKAKMRTIEFMLSSHKLFKLRYPTQEEGLESMMGASSSAEDDLLVSERLNDGWKRRIRYRFPGKHHPESYDLFSLGADGIEDTEDDVTNWQTTRPSDAHESPSIENNKEQDLPN